MAPKLNQKIVPKGFVEMMKGRPDGARRAAEAMMKMVKLDFARLHAA